MRITDEQLSVLNGLRCVRLSSDTEHFSAIAGFANSRNPNLVKALKESAWEEDTEGSIAYYLVKTKEGLPLLFFSLKCGSLITNINPKEIKERKDRLLAVLDVLKNPDTKDKEKARNAIVRNFVSSTGNGESELIQSVNNELEYKKDVLISLLADLSKDTNAHTVRVHHTHSGIELVHICTNDKGKELWLSFKMPQLLSKIVYWHFIVPILKTVKANVGCKYVFLFAADDSVDETLIKHYKDSFGMRIPKNIGTSKPFYDYNCTFMCREINEIVNEMPNFYDNFNPDSQEYIV